MVQILDPPKSPFLRGTLRRTPKSPLKRGVGVDFEYILVPPFLRGVRGDLAFVANIKAIDIKP